MAKLVLCKETRVGAIYAVTAYHCQKSDPLYVLHSIVMISVLAVLVLLLLTVISVVF